MALNKIRSHLSAFNQTGKTTTGALAAVITERQLPLGYENDIMYVGQPQ